MNTMTYLDRADKITARLSCLLKIRPEDWENVSMILREELLVAVTQKLREVKE
jgi:hypothetical protein